MSTKFSLLPLPLKRGVHKHTICRATNMTFKFSYSLPLMLALLTAACAVGPDYVPPSDPAPAAFKENKNWQPAEPMDAIDRGAWWSVYHDPILNNLEKQIELSNQNLKSFEASYRAALALTDQTRAGLFPTVDLTKDAKRSGSGEHTATGLFDLSAGASWSIDLWGKIRRQVESEEASAEASAADLANARLSAQGTLATDYFAIRIQDALQRMLDQTVANDTKIRDIVKNQYNEGIASPSDLLTAQSTLESAQASALNNGIKRAQLEHAIAVLVGQSPSTFTLPVETQTAHVPLIPTDVPSTLLQRRPDIASAERKMAAANAAIGVAEAAYYPSLTLSASYGFSANMMDNLFKAASSLWSFGASSTERLIDFGARDAATDEARANFDASLATYRQTVLTAFQAVEDNLVAQRILIDQQKAQDAATANARKAEQIAVNQYKEGIIPYNTVLSNQITRLNAEQASLNVQNSRLAASVALIEALGGGWETPAQP